MAGRAGFANCSGETLTATRTESGHCAVLAGRAQGPFTDLGDDPGVLGNRHEFRGTQPAAGRVIPAQQGLESGDFLGGGVDHRLVGQLEPARGQGIAKVLFELAAFLGISVQVRRVEVMSPAAAVLGRIEREIGIADDRLAGHPVVGRDGDADRGADHHPVAVDLVWFGQGHDDPLGAVSQGVAGAAAGDDYLKLVTAEPPHAPGAFHHPLKPLRHLPEQGIPGRMAEGVIDLLEPVEIEQEHGAGAVFDSAGVEYLFERFRHLQPVGEACERIVVREACRLFLVALALGKVAAGTAEALEIVEIVVNRQAVDRPPALLAVEGGSPQAQVLERGACVEVEVQRALAFAALAFFKEQVGEGAAHQLALVRTDDLADRAGDIGDQPAPVGFPEPALAGRFVIREDQLGALLGALDLFEPVLRHAVEFDLAERNIYAAARPDHQCQHRARLEAHQHMCKPQREQCSDHGWQAAGAEHADQHADHDQRRRPGLPAGTLREDRPLRHGEAEQEHRRDHHGADRGPALHRTAVVPALVATASGAAKASRAATIAATPLGTGGSECEAHAWMTTATSMIGAIIHHSSGMA